MKKIFILILISITIGFGQHNSQILSPTLVHYTLNVTNDFGSGSVIFETYTLSAPLQKTWDSWNNDPPIFNIQGIDNQVPADGLNRTWIQWTKNSSPFTTSMSVSDQTMTSATENWTACFNIIPRTPTGVTLSSSVGQSGPIKVSWSTNPEAIDGYEVSRLVMNYPGVWENMGTTTDTYWIDPQYNYAPGGGGWVASYKIRAITGTNYSNYSDIASERAECMWKIGLQSESVHEYSIDQNYPNPFNPSTMISYAIPQDGAISLKVYDMIGHHVATLVDGYKSAGRYNVAFDASKLSSGIYFYKIQAGSYSAIKKMQVLK